MHTTALSLSNKAVQRLWNHIKLSQFTDFFTKLIVFDRKDCDVGLCFSFPEFISIEGKIWSLVFWEETSGT